MADIPQLTEPERRLIEQTLEAWAEVHPRPDVPLIQVGNGSELTPRDFARAAAQPSTELGAHVYRLFAIGLIEDDLDLKPSLDRILQPYRSDTERWSSRQQGGPALAR